jgi:ATP-dependent helicase/nuclease subunit B
LVSCSAVKSFVISLRSELRLERARAFLKELPRSGDALLIGPSFDTIAELMRSTGAAIFGWRRSTLYRCALDLARPELVAQGLTPVSPLSLEAVWARVTYELGEDKLLHRLQPLEGRPGLSRALARTVGELRMLNGFGPHPGDVAAVPAELREALRAYEALLAEKKLADKATVFAIAMEQVAKSPKAPLLVLDVPAQPGVEIEFIKALVANSPRALVTAPAEDTQFIDALGMTPEVLAHDGVDALSLLQRNLFGSGEVKASGETLPFFSAPGETRESVEIARRVLDRARAGVKFDDIAVLLRSPGSYRAPLEEAFRRAGIPAWFTSGIPKPDPAGRALLSLLLCAEEGLSARRFSEYLSLAQVPQRDEKGAPPKSSDTFALPESESLLPASEPLTPPVDEAVKDVEAPAVLGQLRAPRRWEKLIIEAAVIGGADRWKRRLTGLRASRMKALQNPTATDGQKEHLALELAQLNSLEQFALPLLEELVALPAAAHWGEWRTALSALATRALKYPSRVLAVLSELAPMDPVGPVSLPEVRTVLTRRLTEVTETKEGRRNGHVFVGSVESARGLSFDTVFIPGLAERVFPQKIREDPLLADEAREKLHPRLEVARDRIANERHALQLAVGAARVKAVLSYPRVDAEHARPRVPSFYALEAARAVQGKLPGFEELQRQAEASARIRLAWPAPDVAAQAIDDTEYDLAVLDGILHARGDVKGRGRYLVKTNPHLARALRARFARWQQSTWTSNDGFVKPGSAGRAALERHQPASRPFSPTSLEQYAACPYRFFLSTLVRIAPLEIPGELEELGPLEKGSMAHEVQFTLLNDLRAQGVVVTPETLTQVQLKLHDVVKAVASSVYDTFKPAIERVWTDGVHVLEADLREWLKRVADEADWKPAHFELSFGLANKNADEKDPRSSPDPVKLVEGLQVRGSIDLVEKSKSGAFRATDYKTGKARAEDGNIIGGGRHLQPVLYALVLEKLFPEARVAGGRLFYTTQIGGYRSVMTELNAGSRELFGSVARTIRSALETGFFPAAPEEGECTFCNFRSVCGPEEERRIRRTRKSMRPELKELNDLRAKP